MIRINKYLKNKLKEKTYTQQWVEMVYDDYENIGTALLRTYLNLNVIWLKVYQTLEKRHFFKRPAVLVWDFVDR